MIGAESDEPLKHRVVKHRAELISAREIAVKMPINSSRLVRLYSNSVRFFAGDLNWRATPTPESH
jgi:hypothetical protein